MSQGKGDPRFRDQTDFVDMRELLRRWPVSRAPFIAQSNAESLHRQSGSASGGSPGQSPLSISSSAPLSWLSSEKPDPQAEDLAPTAWCNSES